MDFDLLDTRANAEAGFELQLVHIVTGNPTDAFITVRGVESATVKKAATELQRRLAQRLRNKRGAAAAYDPDEQDEDELGLLVVATVSWRNVKWAGKDQECTPDNVRYFYKNWPAVRKQVERAMSDYANFLPASATS